MAKINKKYVKPPDKLNILCPYCNAVWTAQMEEDLHGISSGCDSCGYGSSASVKIEIKCDNCKRIVYVKEGTRNY